MVINMACRVTRGIKEINDDRVLLNGRVVDDGIYCCQCAVPTIAAVCDGCGGYNGGYIASQMVLGTIVSEMGTLKKNKESIPEILEICKRRVFEKKSTYPEYSQMCTTLAGCAFYDDNITFFHAGDSRVYRFGGTYLAQITSDHTVQYEEGGRSFLSRCIGLECEAPEIYTMKSGIHAGDTYMLCSDGLWGSIDENTLIYILSHAPSLGEACNRLVDIAVSNGSQDNVSVVLCSVPAEEKKDDDKSTSNKPFVLD